MARPFREREIVRVLSLFGAKVWIYCVAALINGAIIGFSFNMVLAFIQMDVMDAAVSDDQVLLIRAVILAAVTFLTGLPMLIGARYVIAFLEKRALAETRIRIFRQIVDLPIGNFDQQHSGDLVSRCTNDLNILGSIFTQLIPNLLIGLVLGLVGIISILIFSWQMGVLALILGLFTTLASTALSKPLRLKSTAIQESLSKLTQHLSDILQSLPVTKMFHLEETTHRLYRQSNQQAAAATIDHASTQALYDALTTLISWIRTIGTLAFGLYLLGNGLVGIGANVAAIHLQTNAMNIF